MRGKSGDQHSKRLPCVSLPYGKAAIPGGDLLGVFAWADYDARVGKMFQREIIKEGDCLLITSHLAQRPGIEQVRKAFSGELSVLGVSDTAAIGKLYRRTHPSFTLFKALTRYRLKN